MVKTNGNAIYCTRGDTLDLSITIYNADGTEFTPASGDTITFGLKHSTMTYGNKEYTDTNPLVTKTISTSDMKLTLDPSDTASLPFGQYVYDIELVTSGGVVDTFIPASAFVITPEVH